MENTTPPSGLQLPHTQVHPMAAGRACRSCPRACFRNTAYTSACTAAQRASACTAAHHNQLSTTRTCLACQAVPHLILFAPFIISQGWPSSPQEGQLLAAGGAQYLAPGSGSSAPPKDSVVVHDFHAALGRSPDMAVAVAAIKVRGLPWQPSS